MTDKQRYQSVWDALEDDPVRRENLKLRSDILRVMTETLKERELTQQQVAELLECTQPWVNALLLGKIDEFGLDMLIDFAHRLRLHVSIEVAA
jgi:predicted XRE-type DNA-binding protein